jgi:hypothetical protein
MGTLSTTVSIPNSDPDRNPYEFTIYGYGSGLQTITGDNGYYGLNPSMDVEDGRITTFLSGGPPQQGDWYPTLKFGYSSDYGVSWSAVSDLLSYNSPMNPVVRASKQYSYWYGCFVLQSGFELRMVNSYLNGTSWTANNNFPEPAYMVDTFDFDISMTGTSEYYYIAMSQLNIDPEVKKLSLRRNTLAGNASNWDDHDIDTSSRPYFISLEGGAKSYIHVSYQDYDDKSLKFARCTNLSTYNSWDVQTLDTGSTGYYTSIGSNGTNVYISYYDAGEDSLKFIRNTNSGASGSWSSPVDVDPSSGHDIGKYSSLALAGSDDIYISYYDATDENLMFARSTNGGSSWTIRTVDDSGTVADTDTEIQVDGGVVYIIYSTDASSGIRNLNIAKSIDNGNTW